MSRHKKGLASFSTHSPHKLPPLQASGQRCPSLGTGRQGLPAGSPSWNHWSHKAHLELGPS